eukprot:scaffold67587_cov52-Prasinocladus_malaysianus.AAC.1
MEPCLYQLTRTATALSNHVHTQSCSSIAAEVTLGDTGMSTQTGSVLTGRHTTCSSRNSLPPRNRLRF